MSEKIKLIYIAGSGHCGSTLLDLIIGSAPDVFSVGELSFYNIYRDGQIYNKKNPSYVCTCKNPFNRCPFWKEINQKADFKIKKRYSLKENLSIVAKIIFGINSNSIKDDSPDILEEVLKEAKKQKPETNIILDSSKDPRRLYMLLNDPRIEILPVLLKREGFKVAMSYNNKNRPIKYGIERKNFLSSYVLRWWLVNLLCVFLLKNKRNTIKIIYERFCKDPTYYVKLINKRFGVHIDERGYLKKLNGQTYHNIDGNRLRFKKIESIKADGT